MITIPISPTRFLLLGAILALLLPGTANAQAQPQQCPVVVENTVLKTDCLGPMLIAADNVNVNLGTHQVICDSRAKNGIMALFRSGVHILNGRVRGCNFGIWSIGNFNMFTNLNLDDNSFGILYRGNDSQFESSHYSRNQTGLVIDGGDRNRVESGMVFEHNEAGINLALGTDNTIASSTFSDNNAGVLVQGQANSRLLGNHFSRHEFFAIAVGFGIPSTGVTVQGNEITLTTGLGQGAGVLVTNGSSDTVVIGNHVHDNPSPGISMVATTNNQIVHNNVTSNRVGIYARTSATNNYIAENTARFNVLFDLQDDNPNCDANIWRNNNNVTQNQACID
jgi:parallel beta-helix repeat protein